jgi:hypothetical protein
MSQKCRRVRKLLRCTGRGRYDNHVVVVVVVVVVGEVSGGGRCLLRKNFVHVTIRIVDELLN